MLLTQFGNESGFTKWTKQNKDEKRIETRRSGYVDMVIRHAWCRICTCRLLCSECGRFLLLSPKPTPNQSNTMPASMSKAYTPSAELKKFLQRDRVLGMEKIWEMEYPKHWFFYHAGPWGGQGNSKPFTLVAPGAGMVKNSTIWAHPTSFSTSFFSYLISFIWQIVFF